MQNRRLRKKNKKPLRFIQCISGKARNGAHGAPLGPALRSWGQHIRLLAFCRLQKMSSTLFEIYVLSNLKISRFTDSCHLVDFSILLPRYICSLPRHDGLVWDVQDGVSRDRWLGCEVVRRRFWGSSTPPSGQWCPWSTHVLFGLYRKLWNGSPG